MATSDPIAAIATAPGRGGIGIVRVSGANIDLIMSGVVGRRLAPRRATRVKFVDGAGSMIDEGIAIYFSAPRSYTGEEVIEFQGHGGPIVMQLLLDRCLELGARLAQPGEFTRRAYLNDRMDLAQAEAVVDVIDAATREAARSAVRSMSGEFSYKIQELNRNILELRSLVEATLDFPDEEEAILHDHEVSKRLAQAKTAVERVIEVSRQGKLLRDGLRVVLAGRPNVGKSSLLNSLAGGDVAIVTEIPGTTRDAIRETISIGGLPVHVIDTAGLRESQDQVEQIGMARTRQAIADADVVVMVLDAMLGETPEDAELISQLPPGPRRIRVFNKIDLVGQAAKRVTEGGETIICLSAKTGEGVEELRGAMHEAAGWHGTEGTFLARTRHLVALNIAVRHIEMAASRKEALELCAEELRLAHEALASITGRVTPDDILGEIFSKFCIGK